MAADNQTIGSDWRGRGMRAGLVSVMAATGMVLAGQAAQATTTVTESPTMQADGAGEGGLPLDLRRLAGGNSGATCGDDSGGGGSGDPGGSAQGGIGINVLTGIGVLGTGDANVNLNVGGGGSANGG